MNTIDFCYWLQGYFELSESDELSNKQVQVIKNHLNLVFLHEIDPLRESQTNASKEELNTTHSSLPDPSKGESFPLDCPKNDSLVRC